MSSEKAARFVLFVSLWLPQEKGAGAASGMGRRASGFQIFPADSKQGSSTIVFLGLYFLLNFSVCKECCRVAEVGLEKPSSP